VINQRNTWDRRMWLELAVLFAADLTVYELIGLWAGTLCATLVTPPFMGFASYRIFARASRRFWIRRQTATSQEMETLP
jgi:hypothetical protein